MIEIPECEGKRMKNPGVNTITRLCQNPAKIECPSCDAPLCNKCSKSAVRHRKMCYGGKDIQ